MKITGVRTPTQITKTGEAKPVQQDGAQQARGRDTFELKASEELKELTELVKAAESDELSVDEIKAQVKAGSYQPDMAGVADRLGDAIESE